MKLDLNLRLSFLMYTLSRLQMIIYLGFMSFCSVVPESPRWLLSQKRTDEAVKILEKMSKVNGESLPKMDEIEDEVRLM